MHRNYVRFPWEKHSTSYFPIKLSLSDSYNRLFSPVLLSPSLHFSIALLIKYYLNSLKHPIEGKHNSENQIQWPKIDLPSSILDFVECIGLNLLVYEREMCFCTLYAEKQRSKNKKVPCCLVSVVKFNVA